MTIKHIAFTGVERGAWVASQRAWLDLAIEAGGLAFAYGAFDDEHGTARAALDWVDETAMRGFNELAYDRTSGPSGGRYSALYLEKVLDFGGTPESGAPVGELGPAVVKSGAAFIGETLQWVKDGCDEDWLASQRPWTEAMASSEGFVGGRIARGRRAYLVTSFWRSEEAHVRYVRRSVPKLRSYTRGDELCARLVRFDAPIVEALGYPARAT